MNWKNQKVLGWIFTLNNPTLEDYSIIQDNIKHAQFHSIILGIEIGKANTPHLQGFVQFREAKNIHQIKRKFLGRRAHLQHCKSVKDAIKYCIKGGKWLSVSHLDFIKEFFTKDVICTDDDFLLTEDDLDDPDIIHYLAGDNNYRHGRSIYYYNNSLQTQWCPVNDKYNDDYTMDDIQKLCETFFTQELSGAGCRPVAECLAVHDEGHASSPPVNEARSDDRGPAPKRQRYNYLKEIYFDEI